jgi:hypothetical protein
MARCSWNGTVAWNDPAAYETLAISSVNYKDEIFYRVRLRTDSNFDRPGFNSVPAKILRIFTTSPSYNDMNEVIYDDGSLISQCVAGGAQCQTYWGSSGDQTANPSSWHTVEWYFNAANGTIRVWHDGKLVRDNTGLVFNGARWYPFFLGSNFSAPHDATNYVYFDNIEIFSDMSTGATGSMADATIRH